MTTRQQIKAHKEARIDQLVANIAGNAHWIKSDDRWKRQKAKLTVSRWALELANLLEK